MSTSGYLLCQDSQRPDWSSIKRCQAKHSETQLFETAHPTATESAHRQTQTETFTCAHRRHTSAFPKYHTQTHKYKRKHRHADKHTHRTWSALKTGQRHRTTMHMYMQLRKKHKNPHKDTDTQTKQTTWVRYSLSVLLHGVLAAASPSAPRSPCRCRLRGPARAAAKAHCGLDTRHAAL